MTILKRIRLIGLSALALVGMASCTSSSNLPATQRKPSYMAVETYSGRILYSSNPNELRPIGMLTNLATAITVADWLEHSKIDIGRVITVPAAACRWPRTNLLHLRPGDRITLRDALHSALMWDDSACAITLAYAAGATLNPKNPEAAFVDQMNQMASEIGMRSTWFKGSSGTVISQSDAHDIAKLGMYAVQKEIIKGICSKRSYVATINGSRTVTIINTNSMLRDGSVEGLRAALSPNAGACLMLTAMRGSVKRRNPRTGREDTYPQRLLIIVLGAHSSQSRYKLATMMLRDSWNAWEEWQKSGDYSNPYQFVTLPR